MEAKKMATSSGIEIIVQSLSKAVEAARGLDSNLSQNLCFALNIASSEAGRVAKSVRKASASQKIAKTAPAARAAKTAGAAKTAKKAGKPVRAAMSAKQQQQPKSRRRASTLNGAVAH
jgi:N-acyl-D-aspartate/D-glutamate deacylase